MDRRGHVLNVTNPSLSTCLLSGLCIFRHQNCEANDAFYPLSLLFFSSKTAATTGRLAFPSDRLFEDSSVAFFSISFSFSYFLGLCLIQRLHDALARPAQLRSITDASFDLGYCPHLLFLRVPTEDHFLFLSYLRLTACSLRANYVY